MKSETKSVKRNTLFDLSVVSVIRAMGKAGFVYVEARQALDKLNVPAKDATIRCQLFDGKSGKELYGVPAKLTAEQMNKLKAAAKGAVEAAKAVKDEAKAAKAKVIADKAVAEAKDAKVIKPAVTKVPTKKGKGKSKK